MTREKLRQAVLDNLKAIEILKRSTVNLLKDEGYSDYDNATKQLSSIATCAKGTIRMIEILKEIK